MRKQVQRRSVTALRANRDGAGVSTQVRFQPSFLPPCVVVSLLICPRAFLWLHVVPVLFYRGCSGSLGRINVSELRTRERQLRGTLSPTSSRGRPPTARFPKLFLGGHLGDSGEPGDWVWLLGAAACALLPSRPSYRNVLPRGPAEMGLPPERAQV